MSAPDTNIEKQARRHRPAFIGIAVALALAALAAIVTVAFVNIPASEQATPVPETLPDLTPQIGEGTAQ